MHVSCEKCQVILDWDQDFWRKDTIRCRHHKTPLNVEAKYRCSQCNYASNWKKYTFGTCDICETYDTREKPAIPSTEFEKPEPFQNYFQRSGPIFYRKNNECVGHWYLYDRDMVICLTCRKIEYLLMPGHCCCNSEKCDTLNF